MKHDQRIVGYKIRSLGNRLINVAANKKQHEGAVMTPTIFSMAVMPHPHFDFLDNHMEIVNYAFAFAMGGAVGLVLFFLISETFKYLNE